MTDSDKIVALQELLSNAIHSLEMTQYDIEDATASHDVVIKADAYHEQMLTILYREH